mmetsp:Transcript_62457/g.122905  ORF Transcript_62457/g.122905 Transcript_62457/m.122905 type:complete len:232 (+) Transcript_62457:783-1478(+)
MIVLISRLVNPSSMDINAWMNSGLLSVPLLSVSMRSKMEPTSSANSSRDMPCTSRSSACFSTSNMCCSNRFFAYMPWMICIASGMNSSYSTLPSEFMSASAKNRRVSSSGKSRRCWRSVMRRLNSLLSKYPLPSLSYLANSSWMMASTSSSGMPGSSAPSWPPLASVGKPLARQSKYLAANSLMFAGWFRSTSRVKSFKMSGNSGGIWNCFANLLDMMPCQGSPASPKAPA